MKSSAWKYKDGNRNWWTITVRFSGKTRSPDNDYFESEWECRIDCEGVNIYKDTINTQYDEPINLLDVLQAWTTYINNVALGMATYTKQIRQNL